MCGLAGFLPQPGPAGAVARLLDRMLTSLAHRGPDGEGSFLDLDAGIALGHRRLAILDLSPAGRQPMISQDGRWVLSFVGEIYNHPDLRRALQEQGVRFHGHADTEVLLEAVARWGLAATLDQLNGMFAIALWDRQARELVLARDPVGIKPLYWGRVDGSWMFASELKAIRAASPANLPLDRQALTSLLRRGYIAGPRSIYAGVAHLPPGHWVRLAPGSPDPLELRPFWSLEQSSACTEPMSEAEAVEALTTTIRAAVRRQMGADVPLGAFLSGGLDSSTVVAAMCEATSEPVRTFTIGFEGGSDERPAAAAIAHRLGTEHRDQLLTDRDALTLIPALPALYDEPLADPSQIPTLLLSRLAKTRVSVALSGDGGDELFAGYPRYAMTAALWTRAARLPRPLRQAGGGLLTRTPAAVLRRLQPLLPHRLWRRSLLDTSRAAAGVLQATTADLAYEAALRIWPRPHQVVIGADPEPPLPLPGHTRPFADRMRLQDMTWYLPDDILAKVDRASMSYGLEVRVPLLDRAVVELCLRLPPGLVDPARPKHLLRQVRQRLLPADLVQAPPPLPGGKSGFSPPVGMWLRGPLRSWAEDLLTGQGLSADGLFHPAPVRRALAEHLGGRQDHAQRLWTILMATAWLHQWRA